MRMPLVTLLKKLIRGGSKMAESEFDELDKAVASVLGTPTTTTVSDDSSPETAPSDSSPEPSSPSSVSKNEIIRHHADQTHAPLTQVSQRPARPTGRFMDVVHPSSDMRPQQRVAPRFSLSPELEKELASSSTPEAKPASEASSLGETSQPQKAALSDSYTLPDPLDFHHFNDQEDEKKDTTPFIPSVPTPKDSTPSEPVKEEPEEASVPFIETSPEPLTSPFLTDAKVEKRPLGAFSTTSSDEKPEVPTPPSSTPVEPRTTQPEDLVSEEGLPAELHSDLLSIEAAESVPVTPKSSVTEQPLSSTPAVTTPTSVSSTPIEKKADVSLVASSSRERTLPKAPESASSSAPEVTPVPSIVQQYKEKPSSNTKPTVAIYDTEILHKPLVHTTPKKSGWMIVVWIVTLILVGIAIGAGIYYVVLPAMS